MTAVPLRLEPGPDETWNSYLTRVAATNACTLAELADHLDLRGPRGRWPGYYGVTIAPEVSRRVAPRLGLTVAAVKRMHLAAYDQHAFDLGGLTGSGQGGLGATRATVHAAWTWLAGSTYCPVCLADTGGTWRLTWRIPWITTCLTHATPLHGTCPRCGAVPGLGNQFNATAPARLRVAPDGRRCAHPEAAGQVCGADLTRASRAAAGTDRLARTELMTVLVHGGRGTVAGATRSSRQTLRAWQASIGIATRLGVVDTGGWGRTHRWANPPRDPDLIDRLLATVQPLITAPSRADSADVLDQWCQQAGVRTPHRNTFDRISMPSSALRPVIDELLTRHGRAHTVIQRRLTDTAGDPIVHAWEIEDVPQLVWACALPPRIRASTRPDQRLLRVVVAMALVRMHGAASDWATAGAAIGVPEQKARNWARHAFATRWGLKSDLLTTAQLIATYLQAQPQHRAWQDRPPIDGYGVHALRHAQQPGCGRQGDQPCPCQQPVPRPLSPEEAR